jgi:hypothetical protein
MDVIDSITCHDNNIFLLEESADPVFVLGKNLGKSIRLFYHFSGLRIGFYFEICSCNYVRAQAYLICDFPGNSYVIPSYPFHFHIQGVCCFYGLCGIFIGGS